MTDIPGKARINLLTIEKLPANTIGSPAALLVVCVPTTFNVVSCPVLASCPATAAPPTR